MTHDEDVRRAQRQRRFGPNARCTTCGESDPIALVRSDLCYSCHARQAGKSDVELHHVAGRHNSDFTVSLPANEHRLASDYQNDWPERTLRNPDSSPLLHASAWIRGFLDVLRLIIDRILGWIPEYLEKLDASLSSRFGQRWWDEFDEPEA
jgi:hypothetical protein